MRAALVFLAEAALLEEITSREIISRPVTL
jgi:hypothetical protein